MFSHLSSALRMTFNKSRLIPSGSRGIATSGVRRWFIDVFTDAPLEPINWKLPCTTVEELYKQRRKHYAFIRFLPRFMVILIFGIDLPYDLKLHQAKAPDAYNPFPGLYSSPRDLIAPLIAFPAWSFFRSTRWLQSLPQFAKVPFTQLLATPLSRNFLLRNAISAPIVGLGMLYLLDEVIQPDPSQFQHNFIKWGVTGIAMAFQPYIWVPSLAIKDKSGQYSRLNAILNLPKVYKENRGVSNGKASLRHLKPGFTSDRPRRH
eukprot:TRINITY_DN9596_c0_g1_i1.p1 TRINITY_DN9596_c0_g1~~TRINITY_DN9596_c0_g1_i1.p1  ORF type:complete len:262 (-),score=36.80 TRINITY_DN9596_c0_g1_i1:84-869(-)